MSLPIRITAPLLVFLLAGCSPQSLLSAASNAASGGSRTATIMDDYYSMPAGSVTVPAGWKYAGAVLRVPGCHGNPFLTPQFTVGSADGLTAVAALPGATWSYSTSPQLQRIAAQQKCPGINITTAADFLDDIVAPALHPGTVITKVGPGSAALQQQVKNQQAATQAGRLTANVTGAAVRIEYQRGNQTIEEELSSVVTCSVFHSVAMFAAPSSTTTTCNTFGITAVWAPKGKLDEFMNSSRFHEIVSSAKTNTEWLHRVVADQRARFQRSTADFNRVCAQNLAVMKQREDDLVKSSQRQNEQREISTQHSIDNANEATIARSGFAHQVVNFASDRMDYINPSTGQRLNIDYNANHSWGSTDGSAVVLNGSPTYDPNGSVNPVQSSWVELVPAY